MLVIPAIDLKNGACVRLCAGDMGSAKVYDRDPAAVARRWIAAGAQRIHVVDLDGAYAGKPRNREAIVAIVRAVQAAPDVTLQLGGGIRDLETVEAYLDLGVDYVIIGTAAVKHPVLVQDACAAFPGHVLVALDARDGKVATDGWSKTTDQDAVALARIFEDWGVEAFIYTDIGRDGMLSGVNLEATLAMADALSSAQVIASGGVATLEDIRALAEVASRGILGVIAGKALYEGRFDLAEAQRLADAVIKER